MKEEENDGDEKEDRWCESGGWLVLEDVTVTLTRVRRRSNEHMVPISL